MSKSALAKANRNEQYSRKYNIKFHGIAESHNEDPLETVNKALKDVGLEIKSKDVTAAHRVPGKRDVHRHILIKLQNLTAKSQIMKKRSDVKKENKGWKITSEFINSLKLTLLYIRVKVDKVLYRLQCHTYVSVWF